MVKSQVSTPSPSVGSLRIKLGGVARRHNQMKASFHNLKKQIKIGLIEAKDVFDSLSVPLMKLVGLKTKQMADEGRSSTIVVDSRLEKIFSPFGPETPSSSSLHRLEKEPCYKKAMHEGKALVEKQKIQFQKLLSLLRGIQAQVNSREENIRESLSDHRVHLQKVFQQAIRHLCSIQQTSPTSEDSLVATHKLLQTIFQHVQFSLASIGDGVEDLVTALAQHMCLPMMDYVKSLKSELTGGSLIHLVALVEEMEGVMRDKELKLEEARRKMRVEEEKKMEALRRLKDANEKRRAMAEFVGVLLEAKRKSKDPFTPQQVLVLEEEHSGDEKLLWDLLKEKNKVNVKASPLGTQELLRGEPNKNDQRVRGESKKPARTETKVNHRPITRSSMKALGPHHCPDLGSSPSIIGQHELLPKRTLPVLRVRKGQLHG